jgi:hypothetical protein
MARSLIRPLARIAIFGSICTILLLISAVSHTSAQEGIALPDGWLAITSSDAESAPTIVLRAFGMDSQGLPLILSEDAVVITHGNQSVGDVRFTPDYKAGTYTLFLVDLPPGVTTLLPSIEEFIQQYSNAPFMEERTDHIVIYRVGESEASELLPPTNFYNTIRNFFTTPLGTQGGPTALVDSLGSLIENIDSIKPKDDLFTSIVVFTDGTDVVSSRYQPEEIGSLAADLGIPIHTVWLENENLQAFSHNAGREYLAQLSAQSRGVAARYDQPSEVTSIWERIASFRNQKVVQYSVLELSSGEQIVTMSLKETPDIQDLTSVVIPSAAPSVVMDIPAEGLELILEDLNTPITLSLSAVVSWLDGAERTVSGAELIVNGIPVQELDVETLDRFSADIGIFNYGPNTIQVGIIDEQGSRAISPSMQLMVSEGETLVPEALDEEGLLGSTTAQFLLACVLLLVIGAVIYLFFFFLRRAGIIQRISRPRRARSTVKDQDTSMDDDPANVHYGPAPHDEVDVSGDQDPYTAQPGIAYLEILRSVTRTPAAIELSAVEHRLGRSPVQADIVLENDITVSRLHASIVLEGSDYRIYDEGSTSGTLVNGQLVPEYGYQLLDGDEITMGEAVLRYRRT